MTGHKCKSTITKQPIEIPLKILFIKFYLLHLHFFPVKEKYHLEQTFYMFIISNKMKYITLMIVALLLFSCNKQEIERPMPKKENANIGIKAIKAFSYSAINKDGEVLKGDLISNSIDKYDEKGNLLESLSYGSDGKLKDDLIYKYDEQGYLTEFTSQVAHVMSPYKWTYSYDKMGREIEMNVYSKDGSLDYGSTSRYDETGNMIERICYDSNDYSSKKVYLYDANGNMIEMNEYYDGSNVSSLKHTYKYDDKGNTIEYIAENPVVHFFTRQTYEFDSIGNMTVLVSYELTGSTVATTNYKYLNSDSDGNWHRKECYLNGVINWITEREIDYY